jgi:8-oxo-dGTP pyrophosphatase MutT (NUDIX family)
MDHALATATRSALRAALDADPRPVAQPGDRLAAVLALLVEEPQPSLVFTERAAHLRRHPGEVSFPGGLVEPDDANLMATALRESDEEIGLEPSMPDVLGALPAVHTFVSGILVTPFVGALDVAPPLAPRDGEIARVVMVPLARLAASEERRELHREGGRVWHGWWYEAGDATVWGATGFMVHALLALVRKEVPWLIPS